MDTILFPVTTEEDKEPGFVSSLAQPGPRSGPSLSEGVGFSLVQPLYFSCFHLYSKIHFQVLNNLENVAIYPASAVGGNADGKTSGVFYDRSRTEHKPITVYKITQ